MHGVQAHMRLVSWNCFGSHISMCVCVRACACVCVCVLCVWCVFVSVCPLSRELITSGMIWCDIDCMQLIKEVLQLFLAFNYFIWHFPLIKWMGMAILTQHIMNACQRKLGWQCTSYKGLPKGWNALFIKVSGRMLSEAFKRRSMISNHKLDGSHMMTTSLTDPQWLHALYALLHIS